MNALLETFSCVYSEIMSNIISFFQKLIKGGVGIRAGRLENFSKINKRGGDDYSVPVQLSKHPIYSEVGVSSICPI